MLVNRYIPVAPKIYYVCVGGSSVGWECIQPLDQNSGIPPHA